MNINGLKLLLMFAIKKNAAIRASDNASIHVNEELTGELSGSGDLFYKGLPQLKSLSVKGAGGLKPL